MVSGMSRYQITERVNHERIVTVFIPYPGKAVEGWRYSASEHDHTIHIDLVGKLDRTYLSKVIELLEYALTEDAHRQLSPEDFELGAFSFDKEVDFRRAMKTDAIIHEPDLPVEDSWIARSGYADKRFRQIITLTLLRCSNVYTLIVGSHHSLTFQTYELEGIIALLKQFAPATEV